MSEEIRKYYQEEIINVEFAFKDLLGWDNSVHADIFRHGTLNEIGEVLVEASNEMAKRINEFEFESWEDDAGQPHTRMMIALGRLQKIGGSMMKLKNEEPMDYHWEIVGSLIAVIAAIFDHLEKNRR